jgi:hypothetical protein
MLEKGYNQDSASSFRMTKNNLIVEFWQDDGWQKRVVRLDSSDPMFRAEENLKCFNLADWSFDDYPSSLKLYAKK